MAQYDNIMVEYLILKQTARHKNMPRNNEDIYKVNKILWWNISEIDLKHGEIYMQILCKQSRCSNPSNFTKD